VVYVVLYHQIVATRNEAVGVHMVDSESGNEGVNENENLYKVRIATGRDGSDEECVEVYHEAKNGRGGVPLE